MAKDFKLGDPVWAKMKGFPHWPGKIIERTEEPFQKKLHHYVYFFGSQNHAWILDEKIVRHSQSRIDAYEGKKTFRGLRPAIDEIAEYAKSMPSAPTSDDEHNHADDESSKPGPSKRTHIPKSISMKYKKGNVSQKGFKKGYFRTKTACFRTKFPKKKSKAANTPRSKVVTRKSKADVLADSIDSDENVETSKPARTYKKPTGKKIGFLGLGIFGVSIVDNLTKSGHDVTVWDQNVVEIVERRKLIEGVKMASSPADLALKCDIIISCLADEAAFLATVHDTKEGVTAALNDAKGYLELTSIGEEKAQEIAELITNTGAAFLDAPISSTVELAENGELVLFASGSKKLFEDCETIFDAITQHASFIGDQVGHANAYNAISNSLSGVFTAALAEGMALANKEELSLIDVLTGLHAFGYGSNMIKDQGINIINNNFRASSSYITKQQRDMRRTLQMGEDLLPMPVTAAASETLVHAKNLKVQSKRHELKSDDPQTEEDFDLLNGLL